WLPTIQSRGSRAPAVIRGQCREPTSDTNHFPLALGSQSPQRGLNLRWKIPRCSTPRARPPPLDPIEYPAVLSVARIHPAVSPVGQLGKAVAQLHTSKYFPRLHPLSARAECGHSPISTLRWCRPHPLLELV